MCSLLLIQSQLERLWHNPYPVAKMSETMLEYQPSDSS